MIYDSVHSPVVGIDLGTTFSSIARWTGTKAEVYCLKGEYNIPSVVYNDGSQFVIGKIAFMKGIINPENMCRGVKRLIGNEYASIKLGDNDYNSIEISAEILKYLYRNVEEMFPQGKFKSEGVVVTVPYHFRANEISNTIKAAKLAGLNLIGIIQEPIAAALAYGLHLSSDALKDENILVFDLGGGTFDLTLFNLNNSSNRISFNVLATSGDDRLGGMDFDDELYNYIVEREGIRLSNCKDKKQQNIAKNKLMEQVIRAKEALSFDNSAFIQAFDVPPGNFVDCTVTLYELKNCIREYTQKIKKIIRGMFEERGISPRSVDKVIKIGGSSKIKFIDEIINDVVGEGKIYGDINPELAVCQGAAIYGAYLNNRASENKKLEVTLINSHALGLKDDNGGFAQIIPKNVAIPYKETVTFTNSEDNEKEITIEIYQGEHKECEHNKKIGVINVLGLKESPKGTLNIPVTFYINKDQTIKVIVEQKESNIYIEKQF
ncbi:Hsp70 family protein [Clostridium sp. WILCCON 0269]|uniref:Chaperone protein DnaK n=1 Tax=Candidatus Clostridium eludens TaxID=3381663 RepID=A0ABW8SR01_9CLOT